VTLQSRIRTGQRLLGSNMISYRVTTVVKQGQKETSSLESVKRTERFIDLVRRAGRNGVLEIDRSYTKLYSTARSKKTGSKMVYRSPLQGRKVTLLERNRRREIKLDGRGSVGSLLRRTAGIEIDWRDIMPDEPVAPGDKWEGDGAALARRMAAYLECGTRSKMQVRFEEIVERDGGRAAKLYIDWTLQGMRDRHLFTKVSLAGDVFFDLDLHRVVEVDLTGNIIVRGALIGTGAPKIVKGDGPVFFKSTLKPAPPVQAAAPAERADADADAR